MKAVYEWCEGGPYTGPQPTLVNGVRSGKKYIQDYHKKKLVKGTGSKRPKVRCPKCGRRLTVKTVDQEPYGQFEPRWTIPKHKKRIK